jgi:Tol biopolymer transport system component
MGGVGRLRAWRDRGGFWYGALGLLLLALPIVYLTTREANPVVPTAGPRMTRLTTSGMNLYPSVSPDGGSVVYTSERGSGFELFVTAADGAERQLTSDGQHNVQPAWSPDGHWIAYHSGTRGGIWLMEAAGGAPKRFTSFGARPAWSPDGTSIAFQSESQAELEASWTAIVPLPPSVIWVAAVEGGPPRRVTETGQPAGGHGSPAWTPRGDRIVFVAYDRSRASLWLVAPDGTRLEQVAVPSDQPMVSDPASCPGCDSIYYVSSAEKGSSGIWRLRLDAAGRGPDWVRSQIVGSGLQRVRHVSLSRDGRRLAYAAVSATAQLASLPVDPATGLPAGEPRLLTSGLGRSSRPQFSPDGRLLAYTVVQPDAQSDVWIARADGRSARALTTDASNDTMPTWFPDNRRVAFLSNRGGRTALWVADIDVKEPSLLFDLGQPFDAPRLSPDGKLVAFSWARGGPTINTWVVPAEGGEPRQLTHDRELMGFPAWSPDGRSLAVQMKRGGYAQVAVVPFEDLAGPRAGAPLVLTDAHGMSWPHSFSPDGAWIAFAGSRDGVWNVFSVSRSTKEQRRLTTYRKLTAYVRYPAWSPRGDQIVYEYTEATGAIWTVDPP